MIKYFLIKVRYFCRQNAWEESIDVKRHIKDDEKKIAEDKDLNQDILQCI